MYNNTYVYGNYIYRYDENVGLLIYSNITGRIYALAENALSQHLRNSSSLANAIVEIVYDYHLDSNKECGQLLPTETDWPGPSQEQLRQPLTINWLISNRCTHKCLYCYADDIIDNELFVPAKSIREIAENILSFRPLNVVLSGGEPFLSPDIEKVISALSNKTGIIIDTNGYCFSAIEKALPLIIEHNVHIRVSLDSLRLKCQSKTRPIRKGGNNEDSFSCIINSLCLLLSNNVNVTIHTVLTKENANDLLGMGDKLWKLGVRNWRIFELQMCKKGRECGLSFGTINDKVQRKNHYFIDQLLLRKERKWPSLQINYTPANGDNNNVVLVLPDGSFYTEGKHNSGKKLIDPDSPYRPSEQSFRGFSWSDHFERYIG